MSAPNNRGPQLSVFTDGLPSFGDLIQVRLPGNVSLSEPSVISVSTATKGSTKAYKKSRTMLHMCIVLDVTRKRNYSWTLEALILRSFSATHHNINALGPDWVRSLLPVPVAPTVGITPSTPAEFGVPLRFKTFLANGPSWVILTPILMEMGRATYNLFEPAASISAEEIERIDAYRQKFPPPQLTIVDTQQEKQEDVDKDDGARDAGGMSHGSENAAGGGGGHSTAGGKSSDNPPVMRIGGSGSGQGRQVMAGNGLLTGLQDDATGRVTWDIGRLLEEFGYDFESDGEEGNGEKEQENKGDEGEEGNGEEEQENEDDEGEGVFSPDLLAEMFAFEDPHFRKIHQRNVLHNQQREHERQAQLKMHVDQWLGGQA